MGEIIIIGLDLAKSVFQVHAVDAAGRVVLRRQIKRAQLLAFFAALSPCLVGMEACSGAHFRARELGKLGHDARLMPPSCVKPYVKRGKTDAADAEAICEAVARPNMRVTPQACLRHDAGENRGAAIGFDDAQSEVVAARGIFWCAS
jgi:transposase